MKEMNSWTEGDWIGSIAAAALLGTFLLGGIIANRKTDQVLGHPRGLFVLFYVEMWERFSYYGMRALLVLYLTKHWLFDDSKANLIYGAYGSLVYITPVLGGLIADRWLGQRKAAIVGSVLLACGHGLMAVEGSGGQTDPAINVFWLALAFIIVGSGFLKANISVLVGKLYPITDPRRDGAYSIYYMGVNGGSALGAILVGYVGETIGWSYGFGLAGIGMVIGILIFVIGTPALRGQGEPPAPLSRQREYILYGIGVTAVIVTWILIQYQATMQNLLIVTGVAMLAYTLYETFKLPKEPRERMFVILFLVALNPIFWGLFEQAGGSLSLYTDKFVDRGGIPTSLFQSINPIFVVALAPLFAGLWQWLSKRGMEPSAPAKFGLALLQLGLGFLVFVWGANSVEGSSAMPILFVFLIYLLHTTGELCLSPVGLSAMTRLSPRHLASFIMGMWFYSWAVAEFVAGKIGEATGGESGEMDKELTLSIYTKVGWCSIGVAIVVLLVARYVKHWMHLRSLENEVVDADRSRFV